MNKKFLGLLSFLVLSLCLGFSSPVLAVGSPNATLLPYTVSNTFISPNSVTSVGAQDSTNINIEFSAEVTDVSMDIIDGGGSLIKHIYDATDVTDPNPKTWDGTDSGSAFVVDGIYTVQIVYADAGGVATDTSNTITVDNTSPVVGSITLTPSVSTSSVLYVGANTTISASSTDDHINPDTCRYSIDGGFNSVTEPTAYNVGTNSCIFTNVDTSAAIGISVSVDDFAGNSFDTSSSWVTVTPDLVAPVITLLGDAVIELTAGSTYVEARATAMDSIEGDLSSSIVIAGVVDTATVGTYTLTYNVTDSLGNVATEVTRTVNVIAAPSSSSGPTGYVRGFVLAQSDVNKATTTGLVLGASTSRDQKLSKEELRQRILKKRLNRAKIKLYDLKHPQVVKNVVTTGVGATTTLPANLESEAPSTGTTTPAKKSFWKFW